MPGVHIPDAVLMHARSSSAEETFKAANRSAEEKVKTQQRELEASRAELFDKKVILLTYPIPSFPGAEEVHGHHVDRPRESRRKSDTLRDKREGNPAVSFPELTQSESTTPTSTILPPTEDSMPTTPPYCPQQQKEDPQRRQD